MVCVCGMGGDVNGEASGKGRGKNHDTQDGVLETRNPRGCGLGLEDSGIVEHMKT